jgi:uncharacterized protein (TIGR02270 family)
MSSNADIIDRIVGQHCDDAACLWMQRAAAAAGPHYTLADLAKLDRRLEANFDALRIAAEAGWRECADRLAWKEAAEVFVAAVLAIESDDTSRLHTVVYAAGASVELSRGLVAALAWLPPERAERRAGDLVVSGEPALRRVGIAALAAHRCPDRILWDEALSAALVEADTALRARAARAVGELGRIDLLGETIASLSSPQTEVRFWAAWSAVLLARHEQAMAALRSIAKSSGHRREQALQLVIRCADLAAMNDWQKAVVEMAGDLRMAIVAAGAAGDPAPIPWLIEQMNVPALARAAGEAFSMITGADLALERLEGKRPDGFQSGPTDDPEDENVEMDPDDNLPWPDRDKTSAWWARRRENFTLGTRFLIGKPITDDWLADVLRHGRQRQRAAAALELAIRRPGTPLFEVRAPGFRQQELLR